MLWFSTDAQELAAAAQPRQVNRRRQDALALTVVRLRTEALERKVGVTARNRFAV
jgi:hypothetical protein